MVNSIKTSELISSISYSDLSDRSCSAWQELTFIRNKAKNGKSVSIKVFLDLFEHVAEYIECAAWEAAEKNSEAGKRLFKLHDIAKYFIEVWRKENPETSEELKAVDNIRAYISRLSNAPLSTANWDGLKKITDKEVFDNAGKKVTLADIVLDIDEVCNGDIE